MPVLVMALAFVLGVVDDLSVDVLVRAVDAKAGALLSAEDVPALALVPEGEERKGSESENRGCVRATWGRRALPPSVSRSPSAAAAQTYLCCLFCFFDLTLAAMQVTALAGTALALLDTAGEPIILLLLITHDTRHTARGAALKVPGAAFVRSPSFALLASAFSVLLVEKGTELIQTLKTGFLHSACKNAGVGWQRARKRKSLERREIFQRLDSSRPRLLRKTRRRSKPFIGDVT